ncbi:MAG TPA: VanW family protein [Patescibacteria group bacterium]|nr:VanW family protein [Patescibacteria group bacterium]
MFPIIISTILALTVFAKQPSLAHALIAQDSKQVIADKQYSLADRYSNTFVNNVFSDNILLTLAYMRGEAKEDQPVDWSKVTSDFTYTMVLQPGETFAFHDEVLPEYQGKVAFTTNAHFNSTEGFKSDGWLVADGVCHLASFMNVAARNAGLTVVSPTPHNFAAIPDVPKEFGVAIYYMPNEVGSSSLQNLYITNSFDKPVSFVFKHTGTTLDITVEKDK